MQNKVIVKSLNPIDNPISRYAKPKLNISSSEAFHTPYDNVFKNIQRGAEEVPGTIGFRLNQQIKYNTSMAYFETYQAKHRAQIKPLEGSAQKENKRHIYSQYRGENKLGIPFGFGKLIWLTNEYDHEEQDDEAVQMLGQTHAEETKDNLRQEFVGEFKNGMLVHGHLEFADKSFYVGDFNPVNNKFHGLGRFSFSDEIYYQGSFSNGMRHGLGEEHMLGGHVYKGNFFRGMKHGKGKILFNIGSRSGGQVSYQGEFKEGRKHGQGREIFAIAKTGKTRYYEG